MQPITPLLLSAALTGIPDNPAKVFEVETKALAQRRAIDRGILELDSTTWKDQELYHKRKTKIWFDGHNIRADVRRPYRHRPRNAWRPFYRDVRCYAEDKLISWSDRVTERGNYMALTVRARKQVERKKVGLYPVIDPRLIGMGITESANLVHYSLRSFVAQPQRKESRIEHTTWQGHECQLVHYVSKTGYWCRIWIVPDWGHSVVRMEGDRVTNGRSYEASLECEVQRHDPAKIWFPTSCIYNRTVDGAVTKREELKVRVFSLNEPVDPSVFTLAGMDIRPGTFVSAMPKDLLPMPPEEHGQAYWDGKKLVTMKAFRRAERRQETTMRALAQLLRSDPLVSSLTDAAFFWEEVFEGASLGERGDGEPIHSN